MIKRYTLENKPKFVDGEKVRVDMSYFGDFNSGILNGKVVGRGMVHVIDDWLIEFEHSFGETYPFKVFAVPHTAILDEK